MWPPSVLEISPDVKQWCQSVVSFAYVTVLETRFIASMLIDFISLRVFCMFFYF